MLTETEGKSSRNGYSSLHFAVDAIDVERGRGLSRSSRACAILVLAFGEQEVRVALTEF